jgi:GDP/UDP-N,N'-diacetylbacillosamine 2-epimerase (hydrolysing)
MRKICVITGTRADFGLLKDLIRAMNSDDEINLQLIATGMHLSPEFGETFREIELAGIKIDLKLETLLSSDSSVGVSKSIGLGIISFSEAFESLKPDIVLLLGDRFEIFAAATAALVARIPIAHLHGGEVTTGSIDDSFRHAISKMSNIHLVANEKYRKRLMQMGENPNLIFTVGGLGAEFLEGFKPLSKQELEKKFNFKFLKKNLLITFHPETAVSGLASKHISELLSALSNREDTLLIFTFPNADAEGRLIIDEVKKFTTKTKNSIYFSSLGHSAYLSLASLVDGVVGNSSSGILEVPSLGKATVNIGSRQLGRLYADSVINCGNEQAEIEQAIDEMYSEDFQVKLKDVINPYYVGDTTKMVIKILKRESLNDMKLKCFYDF